MYYGNMFEIIILVWIEVLWLTTKVWLLINKISHTFCVRKWLVKMKRWKRGDVIYRLLSCHSHPLSYESKTDILFAFSDATIDSKILYSLNDDHHQQHRNLRSSVLVEYRMTAHCKYLRCGWDDILVIVQW